MVCFRRSLSLEPLITAPRQAREAVSQRLQEWQLAALSDVVSLILSELVTNALLHAATPIEITLTAERDEVKVAVADRDQSHPDRRSRPDRPATGPGMYAPAGRGLTITDGLADDWGVDNLEAGKQVWAVVKPPATWPHHPDYQT